MSFSESVRRRPSVASELPITGGGRRGSGNLALPSGLQITVHSRTSDQVDGEYPHATTQTLEEHQRRYEALFTVSAQRLRIIVSAFEEVLENGLEKPEQTVPMLPTFVFGWPTGNETGDYLALDLGGTNLRVCLVTVQGGGKFELTQTKYKLTDEQKQDDGEKLMDFCAECVDSFVEAHTGDAEGLLKKGQKIPLSFTFSYPCTQEKIDHGVLIRWTKGFGAPNVEGHDVAEMFRKALEKKKVPVTMVSIINDTTGTLIASHYVNPRAKIGVILGTGCNAAYMEKVKNIHKINDLNICTEDPEAEMAINCEYGAFDSFAHQHLPRTKWDKMVDLQSNKPEEQAYEKMISGRYLGEIVRLVIADLIDEGVLFLGQNTYKLEGPYSFDTAFLSLMESDPTDELLTIIGLFKYFYGLETTLEERKFLKAIATMVGKRAARLSACGIAAIASKMGYDEEGCSVACDGSLYSKYPKFPERLHDALVDIFGVKGKNIVTHHAEDGSGVGSAIIAAMTDKRKADKKFAHL